MNSKLIKCEKDDEFVFSRNVTNSCGNVVKLDNDNVYEIISVDYDGEYKEQFYTLCPNCGYMININEELLNEDVKTLAREKNSLDRYLFRKNELRSELIHLESISNPKKRVKKINMTK